MPGERLPSAVCQRAGHRLCGGHPQPGLHRKDHPLCRMPAPTGRWLTAYAAEYGFALRWPEERQAATGMVYEPWHWRYVGVENALAIRASGLWLEECLALERTKL